MAIKNLWYQISCCKGSCYEREKYFLEFCSHTRTKEFLALLEFLINLITNICITFDINILCKVSGHHKNCYITAHGLLILSSKPITLSSLYLCCRIWKYSPACHVSSVKIQGRVSHLATHSSVSDSSVFAILPIHCIPQLASLHDDNNADYQLSYQTIWHCQMQIRKHLWAPSVQCYDLNVSTRVGLDFVTILNRILKLNF